MSIAQAAYENTQKIQQDQDLKEGQPSALNRGSFGALANTDGGAHLKAEGGAGHKQDNHNTLAFEGTFKPQTHLQ